jgi:hypothetical protein
MFCDRRQIGQTRFERGCRFRLPRPGQELRLPMKLLGKTAEMGAARVPAPDTSQPRAYAVVAADSGVQQ